MSGGVRNLRAMFESKEESSISPPDRGRSPAGSIGGGSNGTSPRPLSKVRTSFVTVERSGQLGTQWGLRKENGADPSLGTRRASFSIDEEVSHQAVADRKQLIDSKLSAGKDMTASTESVTDSMIEPPPIDSEKKSVISNGINRRVKVTPAESKADENLARTTSFEGRNTKLLPVDTTSSAVINSGATSTNIGGHDQNSNGNTNGKLKLASPTKSTTKTALTGRTAKPGPISTAPSSAVAKAVSKSTKSPSNPKTPTTPAKTLSTPGTSSKASNSKPAAPTSVQAQTKSAEIRMARSTASFTTASKPAARPSTSSTVASTSENKPLHTSPSNMFHKPRPKSPTRPAKLPASMTAPTTSSLSKVATAALPSRQSLTPATKTVSRARSHANLSQKQELHRKPSKPETDRPALGRPSTSALKKQPSRQSLPKQTGPADESFLARMMRPTTSSASKTSEKIITPPRVMTHTRPTTREGSAGHKSHHGLKGSPSTKKLPPAAKDSQREESSIARSSEVEDAMRSANDISQVESANTKKKEAASLRQTEDGSAVVTSNGKEHVGEAPVEDSTRDAPGLSTASDDTNCASQPTEELVNSELPEPKIEAVQFVHEDSSHIKEALVTEESKDPASSLVEVTVDTEEPPIINMPRCAPPAGDDNAKSDDHEVKDGLKEESEVEQKAEETVTAI